MSKQLRYSKEFQERAVRRMKLGDNISELSRELGVHRTCLYRWKRKHGLRPAGRKRAVESDLSLAKMPSALILWRFIGPEVVISDYRLSTFDARFSQCVL